MNGTNAATLAVAMGVGAVMGCASVPTAAESPSLDGTAWVLVSLPGRTLARPVATTRFEAGRVQGSDGCNRYSAPYSTHGSALQIGPGGASTQMACVPEAMEQAGVFNAALLGTRGYRVQGGQLQLLAADGSLLATFTPQPTSLFGRWNATGVNNGKGGVASLVPGSTVTMDFAADGTVAGSAGCNTYRSSYEADGDTLHFTPAAATRKVCVDAALMEQEQAFFQALETVAAMRLEADRLELRTAQGALALALVQSAGP